MFGYYPSGATTYSVQGVTRIGYNNNFNMLGASTCVVAAVVVGLEGTGLLGKYYHDGALFRKAGENLLSVNVASCS
jgi:hypothetical protein